MRKEHPPAILSGEGAPLGAGIMAVTPVINLKMSTILCPTLDKFNLANIQGINANKMETETTVSTRIQYSHAYLMHILAYYRLGPTEKDNLQSI